MTQTRALESNGAARAEHLQGDGSCQRPRREVVLIGAGYAHVEVLRRFGAAPLPPGVAVTLVTRSRSALYSGMLPAVASGRYD